MKFIIALGIILLAFIITVIILTLNIKYVFYARNIMDKDSKYRLGDWYYNQLTYKEQLLFDEIVEAAEKIANKTDNLPYKFNENEFYNVITSVIFDNPRLFYLLENEMQLYSTDKKTYVKLNYYAEKSKIKKMKIELNKKIDEIVSIIDETALSDSDFDIEVAIHDYIIQNCNTTVSDDYIYNTAYGALINQEAYSGGYSAAFKLLMNKYGLTCYIVEGETYNSRHLWNMVYINDSYFHVDVTWNDGNIEYADDLLFHAYFNISSAGIKEDHKISNYDSLPSAYTENNYYNMKGLYINDISDLSLSINRIILEALDNNKLFIELYTNFGSDIYEGEEFKKIITNSIKQINNYGSNIKLHESFRIYKASQTKNMLTIQLYNLEK